MKTDTTLLFILVLLGFAAVKFLYDIKVAEEKS